MEKEFDVDVTFDESADETFIAGLSPAELAAKVAALPQDLVAAAHGILIERRTYSDVSQDLGIRQPELVRAIHRAKLLMKD